VVEQEVGAGDRLRSDACRGNEGGGGDVAEDDEKCNFLRVLITSRNAL
jgi:hypothetical protein